MALNSAEQLREKLTGRAWSSRRLLDVGFEVGGYLFLNDSSEGSPFPSFVIVKQTPAGLFHLLYVDASGLLAEDGRIIRLTLQGRLDDQATAVRITLTPDIQPPLFE